jgi:succinoglycan biosynthesis protein ExoL
MKICYFVHDINHPDLPRRVAMLRQGGAAVTMLGFRRGPAPASDPTQTIIDLGRTIDGRFGQRVLSVARTLPLLKRWAGEIASSQVIMARNLEMLFLAAQARKRYAPHATLVYECLDIHRLMLSRGVAGILLRQLEQHLLKQSQGLMVSSPGFIREYFEKTHRSLPPVFLVENKVVSADPIPDPDGLTRPEGPPWRIGWFGAIRCRRSLEILTHAVRSAPGLVEVIIAGKPARTVFGDTDASFRGIPGLSFLGPFKDEAALSSLFAASHFAWAADFYETGGNSDWLLPNRVYRAILYGAVPIAMARVETGHWLEAHRAGIRLEEPADDAVVDIFRSMTLQRYADAKSALKRVPKQDLVTEPEESRRLVEDLRRLGDRFGAQSTPFAAE